MVRITEEVWKALSENTRERFKTSICISMPVSSDSFWKRFLRNKTAFDSMKEAYIRTAKAMASISILDDVSIHLKKGE